jgi:hypothetical protein
MNFYNPYFYSIPTESGISSILSKFSLSSIINGTSKTLNLVNQAIPVVKQMSPLVKNLKTMFNVMNEFKKSDLESTSSLNNNKSDQIDKIDNNGLTFFI